MLQPAPGCGGGILNPIGLYPHCKGGRRKIHAQPGNCGMSTLAASTVPPRRAARTAVFSLRAQLALLAAVLVVVPAAIYGGISLSGSREALTQVIGRQLVEEARSGADRLGGVLRSDRERLQALAAQDVMREIRIADFDKRIASLLVSAQGGCTACAGLAVLDVGGRVVAASHPAWIGRGADALPGGAGSGGPIEGPLHGDGQAAPLLRFTVPVHDPDHAGTTLGWLVALMDWERELGVLAHERRSLLSVGLDVEVLVLDTGGTVLGGWGREAGPWRIGEQVQTAADIADSTAARVDEASGMLLAEAPLAEGLPRWSVVVATPLAEAHAPARSMARRLAGALAATLAVALALALLAARRASRALRELTDAARAVGRGERPPGEVAVRSHDEIGLLAEAFNRMAADLKRAERDLVEAAKFSFVGELASGVAHEVRTPLGVLRSSAQILERTLPLKDDESRELLRMLRDEVDRIERVVSSLLSLGRPRQKHIESTPLGPLLARAAAFVEPQAREKGITVWCGPGGDAPAACDPELIYQVVLNLLVNAVQILPPNGRIEVRALPPAGGRPGFEIHDDGPGMSEEVRARIFEPYFTRRAGGTGLGLTFVQRVVHEHRGEVTVESAPGRGTTFRVRLPSGENVR